SGSVINYCKISKDYADDRERYMRMSAASVRTQLMVIGSLMLLQACGAADKASKLFCGDGHAKGKMTVGLNFDFLKDALSLTADDDDVTDNELQDYLNNGLNSAGVDADLLSVDKVESLSDNDEFRFMELGGTFGSGFGV